MNAERAGARLHRPVPVEVDLAEPDLVEAPGLGRVHQQRASLERLGLGAPRRLSSRKTPKCMSLHAAELEN